MRDNPSCFSELFAMKILSYLFLPSVLLGSFSFLEAQVVETPVTIGLVQGGNPQGYIKGSNATGVLFSTTPGGQGQPITYDKIRGEGLAKAIRFEERVEVLGQPRALFSEEKYEEAAQAFGNVARNYEIIINIPENFALEAFFYGAESLRRAGNFSALAGALDLPQASLIEKLLGERYQRNFEFLKLWALFGAEKYDELETALGVYQEPAVGEAKLLASANFKTLPGTEVAQLSYLRAHVMESKGNKTVALDDYYRAFTLAYGNDTRLAKSAMISALNIHAEEPAFQKEGSPVQSQVQALAYLYSKRFDAADLPANIQPFAQRPAIEPVLQAAPKEPEEGAAEAPAGGAEAPAEKGKAPAKAAPAEKGKAPEKGAPAKGEAKEKAE